MVVRSFCAVTRSSLYDSVIVRFWITSPPPTSRVGVSGWTGPDRAGPGAALPGGAALFALVSLRRLRSPYLSQPVCPDREPNPRGGCLSGRLPHPTPSLSPILPLSGTGCDPQTQAGPKRELGGRSESRGKFGAGWPPSRGPTGLLLKLIRLIGGLTLSSPLILLLLGRLVRLSRSAGLALETSGALWAWCMPPECTVAKSRVQVCARPASVRCSWQTVVRAPTSEVVLLHRAAPRRASQSRLGAAPRSAALRPTPLGH